MGFISQLVASSVGGAIGGSFVVIGVNMQFRRLSEAACRAVLLEVQANYEALAEMIQVAPGEAWRDGKANPGWLNRSVWDAQLHYVVQLLDPRTRQLVVRAYATLDSVPEMRISNYRGPGVPYSNGGWINDHFKRSCEAFRQARDYLGDFVADQDSWRRFLPMWIVKSFK